MGRRKLDKTTKSADSGDIVTEKLINPLTGKPAKRIIHEFYSQYYWDGRQYRRESNNVPLKRSELNKIIWLKGYEE